VIPNAGLIDIGQYPHRRRDAFTGSSVSVRGLQAACDAAQLRLPGQRLPVDIRLSRSVPRFLPFENGAK
jgi:hypothetical protein